MASALGARVLAAPSTSASLPPLPLLARAPRPPCSGSVCSVTSSRPARRELCRSQQQTEEAVTTHGSTTPAANGTSDVAQVKPRGRTARLLASKRGQQDVPEKDTPLAQYMQLPASQYSVLDGRKIERISDSTFRCYVGQLKFLSWNAEPVLTLSVDVESLGCTIKLLSCELKGSPFVEELNNKFQARMTNRVRYSDASTADDEHVKQITSDTELRVELEVPGWCGFLSTQTIEGTGSGVLQNVLNLMVPRFLQQLQKDYEQWASGDTSRKPIGEL